MSTRRRWAATAATAVLTAGLLTHPGASAAAPPAGPAAAPAVELGAGQSALVRFRLPDEAMFDRLVAAGADVATRPRTTAGQVQADVVVTAEELAALTAQGAVAVQVIQTSADGARRQAEGRSRARLAAEDTLQVLQAYWWTSEGRTFLQTQVATTASDDPDVEITVTWTTADGATGSYQLYRFEDAGEYQYHVQVPQRLPGKPVKLVATSSLGGQSRAVTPAAWPGATPPAQPTGYQKDFIDAYLTPADIKARIKRLDRQYPALVDVLDLPNQTQGYRRTAAAYLGDPAAVAVVVESVKFGDQGLNGVQVRTVDPGRSNRPLSAAYRDRVLTVSLATDAGGKVISTTDDVAAFITARYPQRFTAFVEEGSAGRPGRRCRSPARPGSTTASRAPRCRNGRGPCRRCAWARSVTAPRSACSPTARNTRGSGPRRW
jgi:hypothetical protein